MHINNLPVEVFEQILEHIPLRNASAVMKVNKEWYQEYRATIQKHYYINFEEILYSNQTDWDIPPGLFRYFKWYDFLRDKLRSFHANFGIQFGLMIHLQTICRTLALEGIKLAEEEKVIDKLLEHYELSSDFEGWFPKWL